MVQQQERIRQVRVVMRENAAEFNACPVMSCAA
jgi:hypothetical protein